MFERISEAGDDIADTAREIVGEAKQITGILTGATSISKIRARTEARDAAIGDFRDNLHVEQTHDAANSNQNTSRC
ncbi:hypothetical protein ACTD5D_20040 [Nocardia takedensis]|uniref:hypothetical protein n=1 Tax=Nocardia takedensis TaxID=259390 RepID=UPI0002E45D41|nr:hypothetical protein [Nocardia takedensis]